MAQSSVKILFAYNHGDLGEQLSHWLQESSGAITIRGISLDSNEHGHCLAILYGNSQGPHYQGQLLFSRRHDGLEEEANGLLADAGDAAAQFVAVGSNQHGHCLCLITAS